MNSEMLAVSFVNIAISKTDYLIPHINSNDKEPSWDGDIEVYRISGNNHAKKDLLLKVPVQIKGHKENDLSQKNISYPVEYADMQNYLAIGGTVFIVVYVDEEGENNQIYYKSFLPFDLKKILNECKEGQKTKNLLFQKFPQSKRQIAELFLNFANNMKRQRPAITCNAVTLEEIMKSGTMPEITFGYTNVSGNNDNVLNHLFENDIYLYAKLPYGLELPVDHLPPLDSAKTTITANVHIGDKYFYDYYEIVYKKDVTELHFGKSSVFVMYENEDKQKLNFKLEGMLSDWIRDEDFIIQVLIENKIEIDDMVFPLGHLDQEEVVKFNIEGRKQHLTELRKIEKLLNYLNVDMDLDCSQLTKADEAKLSLLATAFLEHKSISLDNVDNVLGCFRIANLNILVWALEKKTEKNMYDLYEFNTAPIEVKFVDDGEEKTSSFYVYLNKEYLLGCCNIDYNRMIVHLKSIPISEGYTTQLNFLLLDLLRVYDESGATREDILKTAFELSQWILEADIFTDKNVMKLNLYQIIKRMRPLTNEEKQELHCIIENSPEREDVYVGAYLLLEQQEAANMHFNLMDDESKNNFKTYPIYHFWKD